MTTVVNTRKYSMNYAGIGARKTPEGILNIMANLARRLSLDGWTLRSGGAEGADTAFASKAKNKEIYLPWPGYNGLKDRMYDLIEAEIVASQYHPQWNKCTQGVRKLHARNALIILGPDLQTPVKFVVCWTKDGEVTGGTGLGIRIAIEKNIPVFNLAKDEDMARILKYISPFRQKASK